MFSIGRDGHGLNPARMPFESVEFLPCFYIPDFEGFVIRCRDDARSIGRDSHGHNPARMSRKGAQERAAGRSEAGTNRAKPRAMGR